MEQEGRIGVREAAAMLGLSVRQVRRLRRKLGEGYETQVTTQEVARLTLSRAAVERMAAEREGRSADPNV